jgi:hypothetical protein
MPLIAFCGSANSNTGFRPVARVHVKTHRGYPARLQQARENFALAQQGHAAQIALTPRYRSIKINHRISVILLQSGAKRSKFCKTVRMKPQ